MLQQERFVCLSIEAAPARVDPSLAEKAVEAAREQVAHASTPADAFNHALVQEVGKSRGEACGDGLFPVDEVHDQEIFRAECGQALTPDLLEKPQELRVLELAVQGQPNRMLARPGEVGKRLALLNARSVDEIETLPGSLDEPALAEDFGDAAVARVLFPEEVLFV